MTKLFDRFGRTADGKAQPGRGKGGTRRRYGSGKAQSGGATTSLPLRVASAGINGAAEYGMK